MAMEPHTKIINAVAKRILAPKGFFQKGRSRVWLRDNGWFLTVVEFQPSGFSKGTYVNVAMHFLWGMQLSEEVPTISYDYGWERLKPPDVPSEFIAYYGNDESFAQQVEAMVKAAAKYAENYRNCTDLTYARRLICTGRMVDAGWREYDRAMLCFLSGNLAEGTRRMQYFLNTLQKRNVQWATDALKRCEQEILPRCDTPEAARQMVLDKIQETRAWYLSHSSFKQMSAEPYILKPYVAEKKKRNGFWKRFMPRRNHNT